MINETVQIELSLFLCPYFVDTSRTPRSTKPSKINSSFSTAIAVFDFPYKSTVWRPFLVTVEIFNDFLLYLVK